MDVSMRHNQLCRSSGFLAHESMRQSCASLPTASIIGMNEVTLRSLQQPTPMRTQVSSRATRWIRIEARSTGGSDGALWSSSVSSQVRAVLQSPMTPHIIPMGLPASSRTESMTKEILTLTTRTAGYHTRCTAFYSVKNTGEMPIEEVTISFRIETASRSRSTESRQHDHPCAGGRYADITITFFEREEIIAYATAMSPSWSGFLLPTISCVQRPIRGAIVGS